MAVLAGKANIEIVSTTGFDQELVIRDVGPWDQFMTVTNDAEGVVRSLWDSALLVPGRRLFYIDSEGDLDELIWTGSGRFWDFRRLSDAERELWQGATRTCPKCGKSVCRHVFTRPEEEEDG